MQEEGLSADVEFGVLGPLSVAVNGSSVAIPAPKQRTVLAMLVAYANTTVTVDDLIDEVWSHDPPDSAIANIRTYVRELRRRLGPASERLRTGRGGYLLAVGPDELDLAWFRQALRRAGSAFERDDLERAGREYRRAQRQWRGTALSDTPCGPRLREFADRWEQARLRAAEGDWRVRVHTGDTESAIAELRSQLARTPRRESVAYLLADALYRTGDREAALDTLRRTRRTLAEIGLEPGIGLRRLEQLVLDGRERGGYTPWIRPSQLPMAPAGFVGRTAELADLDGVSDGGEEAPGVVTVSGVAGAGKTALTVHWAQRMRKRYPDGQLFGRLSGPGESDTPARVSPGDVLRRWLVALGVPPKRVPYDVEARSGLFRSLLTDRRMLLLLDDARDLDQVHPLIPGVRGCLVVVTSRRCLLPLVVTYGAHPVVLGPLRPTEARDLLVRRLGADRVRAEPEAVERIIDACSGMPAALAVAAGRAAIEPNVRLSTLADRIVAERGPAGDAPVPPVPSVEVEPVGILSGGG